jgi:hypothetical protein
VIVRQHLRFLVAALVVSASACGSSKPVAPTSSLDGVWSGTIAEGPAAGSLRMDVTQHDQGVAGTFTGTLGGQPFEGTVSGTLNGARLTTFFKPAAEITCPGAPSLAGTLNATLTIAGARAAGQYTGFGCSGVRTGTIDLTRE